MKKILKYIGIGVIIFIIGGMGGLLVDYMIFSKVITHPVWSEYPLIKALDNRVKVVKSTEKIIVENHESIADIASRTSTAVVYVEVVHAEGSKDFGNGVVIGSDGVLATTLDVDQEGDLVYVRLSDSTVHTADVLYSDFYTGITFLKVNAADLATISFANSDEARSGKRLIGIIQSRTDNGVYFASGGLIGNAYDMSIASPTSDHLQGVLKIDFSNSVFDMSVGAPAVDYHGNMVGLVAKKDVLDELGNIVETQHYAIAANDVYKAFEDLLQSENNDNDNNQMFLGVNYEMINGMDVHIEELGIDSGAKITLPATYQDRTVFASTLAAQSGLQGGDIVIMVDNDVVDTRNNLSRLMHKAGVKDVVLKVMREDQLVSIDVKKSE